MIARITGTVVEQLEKGLVIDVGGIGYLVHTTASVTLDSQVLLHTTLIIRDESHELYGFSTPMERDLFLLLLSVSGIGPKSALGMLGLYPIEHLVKIIKKGDARSIALTPGIGKKTAEKVVIDLKDKLERFAEAKGDNTHHDLIDALLSLGYKDLQIKTVVSLVDTALPIEKQITAALNLIQK